MCVLFQANQKNEEKNTHTRTFNEEQYEKKLYKFDANFK